MKTFISLQLALVLLLSALSPLSALAQAPRTQARSQAAARPSCENGECIPGLVSQLEELTKVYQNECLPKNAKENEIKAYYQRNGLTEQCWKFITEINHLETQLQEHQTRLESRLGCESGDCKLPNQNQSLNAQISSLARTEEPRACTEAKKTENKNNCGSDLNCALLAGASTVGGALAEKILPANLKPKNCNLMNDNCGVNLATGFVKAIFSFFEGAWDLLKMAGGAAKKQMTKFWNWVSDAEKHSSTSQLALAKASEEEGFFNMLVSDFPGTMGKIWTGLVGAIKEWLKSDVFCEKWSGVARFSQCTKPAEGFDCISCKAMVNGMCSITGTLVAEIVPAFLTGGMYTAAKYGITGSVRIARTFRISAEARAVIANSRVGRVAAEAASKSDEVLKISRGLQAAKVGVEASLAAIKRYLLSPARKLTKASFTALSDLAKSSSSIQLAVEASGKILVFGGRALKVTAKTVLYPIDNPMTTFAFKAGQRSFEKALTVGAPKLGVTSVVASKVVDSNKELEVLLAKIQDAKNKNQASEILKLEESLLAQVTPKRHDLLKQALKNDKVEFEEIIRHLYPELQYGRLAEKIPAEKLISAEKELFEELLKLPEGATKNTLLARYHAHISNGPARGLIIKDNTPSYSKIIQNSELDTSARQKEALRITNRDKASPEEKKKLAETLEKAHVVAPENGVFEYSWRELREKHRILVDGGFTKDEADLLIRSGLAGRPPVRELIKPGTTLFSGFAEDVIKGDYLTRRDELIDLIHKKFPDKAEAQKIIDNLESFYFVDYPHASSGLLDTFADGNTLGKINISETYSREAFENFKDAREYLLTKRPDVNKETLQEIHRRMMKGGIEGLPEDQLGVIRNDGWGGNARGPYGIDQKTLDNINANPYTYWKPDYFSNSPAGKHSGVIYYPNARIVKKEGLDLIRETHPKVVAEIEEYQSLAKALDEKSNKALELEVHHSPIDKKLHEELKVIRDRFSAIVNEEKRINKELVDAMTDNLMDWFTRERTLIGDINSAEKLDQFVNVAAKFQRDLVSIHPVANGNGRSTRELLSYIFMKEGLPPPRIIDVNADLYSDLATWQKTVKHGILTSDWKTDDIIERLKFGLPIERSIDLTTPYTRPPVTMAIKGQRGQPLMDGVEYIDPRLYREIIKRKTLTNPYYTEKLKVNPLEAWDEIHKEVGEIFAKNNIYYNHPKKGVERVALSFVDDDFIELYGKASYHNKELFDFKMKTWYSEDITWRGLASTYAEKSEQEIVTMFKQLTTHNASNSVLKKILNRSPEEIRKVAIEDFKKYNDDVFGDGLVQMAKDHSETGPMYGMSYGYSTSKNRDVGKAFAQGAMVVGEYGKHKAPELQAMLKSRVLVGARRANKDVDLGRLKQVRDEFSYKYGRQQEVMGIGAGDPDAITIVQTLDAKGEPILSYLRNKNNPNEIFVVKGAIDPDETPLKEQIVKSIFLDKN